MATAKNYLYINIDGKAKKIGKFYYDVGGLAKKVEKAYIRDENGKAVLAYIAHIHSFTSLSYSNTSINYHTITAKCNCGETMISTEPHSNDHLCPGWPHFDASTHWDHYVCKCDRTMSERKPGNAHSYTDANNIRVEQSSTCTTAGYGYWKCDSCAYEKYQPFKLRDHDYSIPATCTSPAKCSSCPATSGSALGHTGGTATCIEKATCDRCGLKYGDLVDHLWVSDGFVDATCTVDGYTKLKCMTNGCTATKKGETIKANGHSGGTATCTKKAVCSKCGEEYGDALGHTWYWIPHTLGSLIGKESWECQTCGKTATTNSRVDPPGPYI